MPIDKSLISGSTAMLLLKLLTEKDMYGYEMIEYAGAVSGVLALHCINPCAIVPAIYARSTPAKLDVGSTTPSLRGRTPDADIRHYNSAIYATQY